MRTSKWIVVFLCCAAVVRAADYAAPSKWKGKADRQTTGNPLVVEGKALWRADILSGDNTTSLDSYKLAPWHASQKRWRQGNDSGTVIPHQDGTLSLGASMTKGEERHPTAGALVFIAPAAGKYTLEARLTGKRWGTPPNQLVEKVVVVKMDRAAKTATEVTSVPVTTEAAELKVEVELAENNELVIVPAGINNHTGCNVLISGLKVTGS